MQKRKKCSTCGGAYIINIPNSFFEREEHLLVSCPYCKLSSSIFIEDGKLKVESDVSLYLKKLPQKPVSTQPWVKLME